MNREDDEELWDFLGKTTSAPVSPFFARNVVRAIRVETKVSGWGSFLSRRALMAFSGLAAAIVVVGFAVHHLPTDQGPATSPTIAVAKVNPDEDFDTDIDDLVADDNDDDVAVL